MKRALLVGAIFGALALHPMKPRAQAQVVTLTASPSTITAGQSSTLTSTITVSGPLSVHQVSETSTVTPTTTTVYTVSVGSSSASVTVTVNPAPPPPAAQWFAVCDTRLVNGSPVSSCPSTDALPASRGDTWSLPFDPVNGEVLLYMGCQSNSYIYSNCLWGYSARTNTFAKHVEIPIAFGATGCFTSGNTPMVGHPGGFQWVDPIRRTWNTTAALCQGYNAGFTSRYDLDARVMLSPLPKWQYSVLFGGAYDSCSGTFNCGLIGLDSGGVFVQSYGKAILGLNAGRYSLYLVEFDGTSYADISDLLMGVDGQSCANGSPQCPPGDLKTAALLSDGTKVWIFGGQTSVGSSRELYTYEPITHRFAHIVPVGGQPPATYAAYPMAAFDSARARILFYAGNDALWQYTLATNSWSSVSASGHGPVIEGLSEQWQTGNACGIDPVQDAMVCVYNRSQAIPPGVFTLQFGQ